MVLPHGVFPVLSCGWMSSEEFSTLDEEHVYINVLFFSSACCALLHCTEAPISSLEQWGFCLLCVSCTALRMDSVIWPELGCTKHAGQQNLYHRIYTEPMRQLRGEKKIPGYD